MADTSEEDSSSITDDVKGAEYYHGMIPKVDVEPLLVKDGDFILRKTEVKAGEVVLAMSVKHDGAVRHFMLNQDKDGSFSIDAHREKSVSALVQYYLTTKSPLTAASHVRLRRPIDRPPWLLNHDSIRIVKKLGEGAFGEVFLAEHTVNGETVEVAIKTMRSEASSENRLKFMKEARLMRRFLHRHLVRIFGVAVHEHPLIIVMEYCPAGALDSYVRKNKGKVTLAQKLRFALEAAEGMAYLHRQDCIHRDVAARNVLLTARFDVKISDFGMSLDTPEYQAEKLKKVPIRWLAPETMKAKHYSKKTDVWAYGVLVWEVYSDGSSPYPGMNNEETRKFVLQNKRMTFPKEAQESVTKMVKRCWEKNPDSRPEFTAIVKMLKA